MPLSPEAQRARRAKLKQAQPDRKPRKRSCLNCDKRFLVTRPKNNPPQRFCSPACRKEFDYFGCAFRPLHLKLEKLVKGWVEEILAKRLDNPRALGKQ